VGEVTGVVVGHAQGQRVALGAGLDLGHWQRIFLLELDRPRERQVVVQVFGA
jgi:thiamine phosphate synthase YjbQ (UPF0047 family)